MPSFVWVCYLICTHVLTSIIVVNGKDGQDLFSSTANMKKLFAKEENVRGNRCTNLLTTFACKNRNFGKATVLVISTVLEIFY